MNTPRLPVLLAASALLLSGSYGFAAPVPESNRDSYKNIRQRGGNKKKQRR